MNKIKEFLKGKEYLIICFIIFFMIDFVLRFKYADFGVLEIYEPTSLLFVLAGCSSLTFIIYLLPGKIKKVFMVISVMFFAIYALAQSTYFNLFAKFITFNDLSLAAEGTAFVDASYIHFSYSLIIMMVATIALLVVAIKLVPSVTRVNKKSSIVAIVAIGMFVIGARATLQPVLNPSLWNANSSTGNIYKDYTDTTKSLLLSGVYEYALRDAILTFVPLNELENHELISNLDEYYKEKKVVHTNNDYTGIFKDKNVVVIQLENIDNWMLTEENMPTLYRLRNEGLDFVNHYSASFSTGRTFNTEFIANTGLIPPTKGEAPSYIFSKNEYPYSLANLMKKDGYKADSYHTSNGNIYNRAQVHKTFGYSSYSNYDQMGMTHSELDSELINAYDKFIKKDKFLSFIITYSGHGPLAKTKIECSKNYDAVKEYANSDDETYVCGLAQSNETEQFIKALVDKMEADGSINNTVLVFYTDHYAYSTIDAKTELELKGTNDTNMLQNTPFFIYSKGTEPNKVEKVTSSIDILPTLTNLMGLNTSYEYYIGHDAFSKDGGEVFFQDGSYYDGKTYYQVGSDSYIANGNKTAIANNNERLQRSWDILNSNYFSKKK
ncbi:MAG: sulfatase-like hydrolase/transferase [Erysipelotrichaceae bacterium]